MRKAILITACVAAISAFTTIAASAQVTGPAAQDNMKTNDTSSGMNKGGTETKGMAKDGMAKDSMSSKEGMKKDGMSK
jgi:pentapeptide MXKDX repeat protein